MEIEKIIGRLVRTFDFEDSNKDAEDLALVNELGEALVEAGVFSGSASNALYLPVVEELVTWRIVTLQAQGMIRKDKIFTVSGDEARQRFQTHPALEVMAKAYERYRKVMKELLERLGNDGEGPRRGLPSIMKPILEKTEDILADALECEALERAARKKRSESRGNSELDESL